MIMSDQFIKLKYWTINLMTMTITIFIKINRIFQVLIYLVCYVVKGGGMVLSVVKFITNNGIYCVESQWTLCYLIQSVSVLTVRQSQTSWSNISDILMLLLGGELQVKDLSDVDEILQFQFFTLTIFPEKIVDKVKNISQ